LSGKVSICIDVKGGEKSREDRGSKSRGGVLVEGVCISINDKEGDCRMVSSLMPTFVNERSKYLSDHISWKLRIIKTIKTLESKVAGSQDRYFNDFVGQKYMFVTPSVKPNVECYKCHNYGHIARDCRYKMESFMMDSPNIRYRNVWRRKQMQGDQANEKVSVVMLLDFVNQRS